MRHQTHLNRNRNKHTATKGMNLNSPWYSIRSFLTVVEIKWNSRSSLPPRAQREQSQPLCLSNCFHIDANSRPFHTNTPDKFAQRSQLLPSLWKKCRRNQFLWLDSLKIGHFASILRECAQDLQNISSADFQNSQAIRVIAIFKTVRLKMPQKSLIFGLRFVHLSFAKNRVIVISKMSPQNSWKKRQTKI